MADYGLSITIHDLDGAVSDAVDRAHAVYEPKFYDWMMREIESQVEDAFDDRLIPLSDRIFALEHPKSDDNGNTEQTIGVNEVEEMISDAINDIDWQCMVRDYGEVGDVIEDYVYNNDLVDKCWVEDELSKVHRDIRDEVLSDIRDEIGNTEALTNDVATLQAQIMGMQADIDFLHEKYNDIYNRRISSRISHAASVVKAKAARIWASVPRIKITKGGA